MQNYPPQITYLLHFNYIIFTSEEENIFSDKQNLRNKTGDM